MIIKACLLKKHTKIHNEVKGKNVQHERHLNLKPAIKDILTVHIKLSFRNLSFWNLSKFVR